MLSQLGWPSRHGPSHRNMKHPLWLLCYFSVLSTLLSGYISIHLCTLYMLLRLNWKCFIMININPTVIINHRHHLRELVTRSKHVVGVDPNLVNPPPGPSLQQKNMMITAAIILIYIIYIWRSIECVESIKVVLILGWVWQMLALNAQSYIQVDWTLHS